MWVLMHKSGGQWVRETLVGQTVCTTRIDDAKRFASKDEAAAFAKAYNVGTFAPVTINGGKK
jgi:hypothetical protein